MGIHTSRVRRAFRAIDRDVRGRAAAAVAEAAGVVAGLAEAKAPVATGRLKASVRVIVGKATPRGVSASVVVSGGHDTPMVGDVEYGNSFQSPRPFFRPAIAAGRGGAISIVEREVT